MVGIGLGLGWKSLKALILRAPLCGANKLEESLVFNQSADDFGKAPDYLVACEDEDEEELLRRAIALSLEESEEDYLAS